MFCQQDSASADVRTLDELASSFDNEDATGNKIQQKLAHNAIRRWGKKFSTKKKSKSLVDKYKRPENCDELKAVKVKPRKLDPAKCEKTESRFADHKPAAIDCLRHSADNE